MSNPSPASNSKKPTRLGRGLGSLLGGIDLDESPAAAKPAPGAAFRANDGVSAQPSAAQQGAHPGAHRASVESVREPTVAVPVFATPQPIDETVQIWTIPVDRLTPNTQQPRQVFTPDGLKDLTASIKEKGIMQPIVARRLSERQFEIIAGERRWRAAQAAGLHEVPVILKKVSEQDSLEFAIIENIQRENLNPMDEADAYEHLMNEYSLTQQEVADKLGKERSSVANSLRLLALAPEVKALVRNTELSAGHAKVLLGVEGVTHQSDLAKQVITQKLSVRATEKLVATMKSARRNESSSSSLNVDVPQRLVEGLSTELQKLLGTKVAIDYADSKGKLSIHFYSDDQLTQVVENLRKAWQK